MRRKLLNRSWSFLLQRVVLCSLLLLIVGCGKAREDVPIIVESALIVDEAATLPEPVNDYAEVVAFEPETAVYFDLINDAMPLTEEELTILAQNGFVLTDRLNWTRFVEAYAWIYKNDLPVVVTTDSILHAVHQSYSNLLQQLEANVVQPELVQMLTTTRAQVKADATQVTDVSLAALYQDVQDYLDVAIVLAEGQALRINNEPYNNREYGYWPPAEADVTLKLSQLGSDYSEQVHDLVQLAWEAGSATDVSLGTGVQLTLFNNPRSIDFTLFQPRAHYNNSLLLSNYFRAMSWLAQADFRFVEFDPIASEPILNQDSVVAAKILEEAIGKSGQRPRWANINELFEFLVGRSDNSMLPDFEQLSQDMGWSSVVDVANSDSEALLNQLLTHDYGQQRITGQLIGRHVENSSDTPIPRPVSFMLLGQRFAVDAWVMGNVVYDRLMRDGVPVERPLPSGFDVMAALGNDRAVTQLQPELTQYNYESTLVTLRQRVDTLGSDFWQAPVYNQWLRMIRALNAPTTGDNYPAVMRTAVWADKTLQTQLASWAQLRHDNILYVKQSYTTAQIVCEFPSVFVEPYPAFYQALYDFAQSGYTAVNSIDNGFDTEPLQTFFMNVSQSAQLLSLISEKELAREPLSEQEQLFLKSLVIEQEIDVMGCGGPSFEEMWDGWYMHLIYGKDETPAIIADVHTNPNTDRNSALYPPRVLHVGTGPATAMLMIVDSDEGPTLYVGPTFSYYEFAEEGFPPVRLNDQQWREFLGQAEANNYPQAPPWVNAFRITVEQPPTPFALPSHD